MRFNRFFTAVFALGLFAATGFAQEKFEFDPSHTNINFTVRHMVVTKVTGNFKEFSGTIIYDENDVTKSSVNVTIKTASINTQHERRDADLRGPNFFDAENYPEITFASKQIKKLDDGYVAVGDFTMRGVTKEVELPFKILGVRKDARGTRIGIEAEMTLNRFDYGVKWDRALDDGSLVVSKEVQVNLNVAAVARKQ